MSPEQSGPAAVFVDHSGRRRRLIMAGSIASSVLALALLAVLVGGVFSDPTLSVNGWPGDRPGAVGGTASPKRSPTPVATPSRRPTTTPVTRQPVSRTPTPAKSATPSLEPRPTQSPTVRPSPGRSTAPGAEPTAEPTDSAEPTAEPTEPPGRVRTPPGQDPDRTKGPKK
ncbi:hypothetical protein ACWGH8_13370 [Nonomuraea muscovyensis]|uniref:hypothetical protein n=1 Tax=Nonomuraea muscovyensis TaxID=1124761 RepID=UPI0033ECBC1F